MKNLFICCLVALVGSLFADTWRLEAEDFATEGKWTVGNHVYDYSNGKVLVATAQNSTIKGKYEVPKAGKYHVWVRTNTLGGNWRKGLLTVNGKDAGIFGDDPLKEGQKAGSWYWQKLGVHDLPAAEIEFKVKAIKGYVRIDAFIISDDEKFVPSNKVSDISKIKPLEAAI